MSKFDLKEIRKMEAMDIASLIKERQINISVEKMSLGAQKKQNYLTIRQMKKEIAVLNTIKREKEILNG